MTLVFTIFQDVIFSNKLKYEILSNFFISVSNSTTLAKLYYTLKNYAMQQGDAMRAKINDSTSALT